MRRNPMTFGYDLSEDYCPLLQPHYVEESICAQYLDIENCNLEDLISTSLISSIVEVSWALHQRLRLCWLFIKGVMMKCRPSMTIGSQHQIDHSKVQSNHSFLIENFKCVYLRGKSKLVEGVPSIFSRQGIR